MRMIVWNTRAKSGPNRGLTFWDMAKKLKKKLSRRFIFLKIGSNFFPMGPTGAKCIPFDSSRQDAHFKIQYDHARTPLKPPKDPKKTQKVSKIQLFQLVTALLGLNRFQIDGNAYHSICLFKTLILRLNITTPRPPKDTKWPKKRRKKCQKFYFFNL